MTALLHTARAVLLAALALAVDLPARGSSRGWGWGVVRGPRWRRAWGLGRGSRLGGGSRRRGRRSASLTRRPLDGGSRGSGDMPGPPGLSAPSGLPDPPGPSRPLAPRGRSGAGGRGWRGDHPSSRFAKAVTRLPRPGREAALRREMEEAVPEVIDVLRATVGAGVNPRRALQAAADGAPSALQPVLDRAIRAAELGSGAGHALATAAKAERLSELVLAGEALDLAETTGGPPGPVLAGVAAAAADRVRSRRARMAATAQARLSARVVAAMAPAFLGVLALTSPSDAAFLIREPLGWATLATAAALELLGIWWATRIVRGPAP
jgi:hypothetical protein